jgi:hypothetical protein
VEAGLPDQFLGLIMLPLAEKAAEHLTAIDEAWDGQMVCHRFFHTLHLYSCVDMNVEFCLVSLSRSFDPNCSVQRAIGRPRWLGTR